MRPLNDAYRFCLEVAGLVALGYAGFQAGSAGLAWVLGLGLPAVFAVTWGRFIAPKASRPLRDPMRIAVEIALFAGAASALAVAGSGTWAIALAAAVALHLALTFALGQRPR